MNVNSPDTDIHKDNDSTQTPFLFRGVVLISLHDPLSRHHAIAINVILR